jgi:hypothetical protein
VSYDKRTWIQITVPVKPDEHARIKAAAAEQSRTLAVYCRLAIVSATKPKRP